MVLICKVGCCTKERHVTSKSSERADDDLTNEEQHLREGLCGRVAPLPLKHPLVYRYLAVSGGIWRDLALHLTLLEVACLIVAYWRGSH